jgi:hypothetical protein
MTIENEHVIVHDVELGFRGSIDGQRVTAVTVEIASQRHIARVAEEERQVCVALRVRVA